MHRKLVVIGSIVAVVVAFLFGCGSSQWPEAPDLTGVETLCLEIEEAMSENEEDWIYNDEDIERILGRLDFELVRGGTGCDATLALTGKGKASGGSYESSNTGRTTYCYTGGSVRGAVVVTVAGQEPVELPIRGSKAAETTTTHCYSTPPYYMMIYSPMLDAFQHLFGADYLVRNMMDEKEYIRTHATEGVQELGDEAGPALFDCLGSPDLRAASFCANYVGGYGGPEVISDLEEKLQADDVQWRCMAAEALGHMASDAKEAVPALILLLSDDRELRADEPVWQYALEALQEITGEDLGRDPAAWEAWWEAQNVG